MGKRPSKVDRKATRLIGLGLVVVEVVRATNDGKVPLNQTQIREQIQSTWKDLLARLNLKLTLGTINGYVKELLKRKRRIGTTWLRQKGHDISLADEDHMLMHSPAIKALLLAFDEFKNNKEDRFSIKAWIRKCQEKLNLSEDQCRGFLEDYQNCGYIIGNADDLRQLNRRSINLDRFYFDVGKDAALRKTPRA